MSNVIRAYKAGYVQYYTIEPKFWLLDKNVNVFDLIDAYKLGLICARFTADEIGSRFKIYEIKLMAESGCVEEFTIFDFMFFFRDGVHPCGCWLEEYAIWCKDGLIRGVPLIADLAEWGIDVMQLRYLYQTNLLCEKPTVRDLVVLFEVDYKKAMTYCCEDWIDTPQAMDLFDIMDIQDLIYYTQEGFVEGCLDSILRLSIPSEHIQELEELGLLETVDLSHYISVVDQRVKTNKNFECKLCCEGSGDEPVEYVELCTNGSRIKTEGEHDFGHAVCRNCMINLIASCVYTNKKGMKFKIPCPFCRKNMFSKLTPLLMDK